MKYLTLSDADAIADEVIVAKLSEAVGHRAANQADGNAKFLCQVLRCLDGNSPDLTLDEDIARHQATVVQLDAQVESLRGKVKGPIPDEETVGRRVLMSSLEAVERDHLQRTTLLGLAEEFADDGARNQLTCEILFFEMAHQSFVEQLGLDPKTPIVEPVEVDAAAP